MSNIMRYAEVVCSGELRLKSSRGDRGRLLRVAWCLGAVLLLAVAGSTVARGQDNPLNQVETPKPPPAPKSEEDKKEIIEGADNAAAQATTRRGRADTRGCEPGAGADDSDRSNESAGDRVGEGQLSAFRQ